MSVNFPQKSGLIQNLIRVITQQINNISRTFDSDNFTGNCKCKETSNKFNYKFNAGKLNKLKLPDEYRKIDYKIDIKSVFESPKFEPLSEYIISSYPNGIHVSSDVSEVKMTADCNIAMQKFSRVLDGLIEKIESIASSIDKQLEPLQKPLDQFNEYISIIQDLLNGTVDITKIIQIVINIIKVLAWLFALSFKPILDAVDKIYELYRLLKVYAAISLAELDALTRVKCVVECKYKGDQSKCPVLKKMSGCSCEGDCECTKSVTCPLLKVSDKVVSVGNTLQSVIDNATIPVETLLTTVNTLLKQKPINMVFERQYPPVTLKEVKSILDKLSENSYMNKSSIVPLPDTSSEIEVSENAKI